MKLKKQIIYVACLLITGLSGSALFTRCNNANKNNVKSIAVDSIFNAGLLKPTDSVVKHTFFIKSAGTADLLIDSVAGSCNCISINWEKKPIKPGDSGFIDVTIKSDTSAAKGKKMQQVIVKTNSTKPFSVFQVYFTR